jgi:hypothetical protein
MKLHPLSESRERSLVRHRVFLVRNRTLLQNKVRFLLEKYYYKTELTDRYIFGKIRMSLLRSLQLDPIDKVIMSTTLAYMPTTKEWCPHFN